MASRWGYEAANRDRVAEAERLLVSHHYTRAVVREIGLTARRQPAASWSANLAIVSSLATGIPGDRDVVGAAEL